MNATSLKRLRLLSTRLCILTAGLPHAAEAKSIAYNFVETDGNTSQVLDTTTPKGPLATTIWNDSYARTSGSVATGTETGLLDSDGVATSAAISWSSKETWYGDGNSSTQDRRIVLGYLDDGDAGNGTPGVFVTVSDIPYATYNVYCIVASDHGSSTTFPCLDFQVNGTTWAFGGTSAVNATAFANLEATSANGTWVRIIPGTQTGNYWKMENLSGSTLTIDGQLGTNNVARGSIAAIIIEDAADTDGDGMPDTWETSNGLAVGINDGALDADSDGLANLAEYQHGTNPQMPDTDGDGLNDGPEVNTYTSDPLVDDTDEDGLDDGDEVLVHSSNPVLDDTDGDELPDGWEVLHSLSPGDDGSTNPDNGGAGDPDADTLDNFSEYLLLTDPRDADSDDDGLMDGDELAYFTDPLIPDSDSDGLSDGAEVSTHLTDPAAADTDADGVDDGDELSVGFDPNDPGSTPAATSPITWTVQKDLLSDADISLEGTLVSALVFGTTDLSVTIGAETIPFVHAGGNTGTFFTGNGGTTGNSSLDQVLDSHEAKESGAWSYKITGLEPGKTYQAQVIAGADRRAGISTRTQVFGDGLGNVTGDLTRSGPGTAIGTFTAGDLGTQTIDVLFGSVDPIDPAMTALIIREVTFSTLELSSFSLNPATQQITLTWVSEEGRTYDVEYSDDLQDWSATINQDPIPATGLSTSLTFPKPAAPALFFRVKEQ